MQQEREAAPSIQSPQQGQQQAKPGDDKGKVGKDTDGDGKVVKPGQIPGQSGGKGLPENK